jgi:ribosomal 50S subunit-recycling heat shock protein
MTNHFLAFFPLQVQTKDLWKGSLTSKEIIFFIVFVAVIIIAIVLVNIFKKSAPSGKSGSKGMAFPGLALRRLTKNIDLNHEQKKMLNFVFKTDDVTDPEKSLVTPVLLDRHFKRAYRVIQQSAVNDKEAQQKLTILFSTRRLLENSPIGTISSTRQIKEETKLTINSGRDKIDVTVLSAKDENIAVETPKNILGSQVKIAKGAKLNILFFTKNNKGFSFETRVTGNSVMRGKPVTLLAHSNQLKYLSQRRYRRKQAAIACFMNLVYVEGMGKKQRLVIDKRRFSGTITDISVGGCSIKTTAPVQVGARFKIEYTEKDATVAALGQVLRTNKAGMNTVLHIKFLRVTQKSMNLINAYVYEYANE